MKDRLKISKSNKIIQGDITLSGSKSISNRVLIISALCPDPFEIQGLASSKDTTTLKALLSSQSEVLNAGAAGTTFRFLTAYLALTNFEGILTGSERMKKRPIGELVTALNTLGARIVYQDKEGYPPLQFEKHKPLEQTGQVELSADVSSQFITALLLIAPSLPQGLTISLHGDLVSKPYLLMTLKLMEHFGVYHNWEGNSIRIEPQTYMAKNFTVEADWSAASYYYSIAAIANQCDLTLHGLMEDSLQGDQAIVDIMRHMGVETVYQDMSIRLTKSDQLVEPVIEKNFLECPDLAQTVIAACAATGTKGIFTGLQTLYIKETDRVNAMAKELQKIKCLFYPLPEQYTKGNDIYYSVEGKAVFEQDIIFDTYEDHRMAMSLAPISMLHPIGINHPQVVEKSYPEFWDDLGKLGFKIQKDTN